MHYLLFYEVSDDYVAKRAKFRDEHLAKAWQASQRGELVLGAECSQGSHVGLPADFCDSLCSCLRNVYRSHFGVTMEHYEQALSFYRDLLGFDLTPGFPPMMAAGQYISAGPLAAGLGVPPEAKLTGVAGHCATSRCEMFEFKDAPRTPFHPPLQDPGAAFLSLWVSDLDGLLAQIKAAGSEVVTPGGSPIVVRVPAGAWIAGYDTLPPISVHSSRQIMVRDPSGFPILLMQRVD